MQPEAENFQNLNYVKNLALQFEKLCHKSFTSESIAASGSRQTFELAAPNVVFLRTFNFSKLSSIRQF